MKSSTQVVSDGILANEGFSQISDFLTITLRSIGYCSSKPEKAALS
jgi:hypothetical protein